MVQDKMNLIALFCVARELGIPIPTDLTTALIKAGVHPEHLTQAAQMNDIVSHIRGCLTISEEELEELLDNGDLSHEEYTQVNGIRELMSPDLRDALKEEQENGEETA